MHGIWHPPLRLELVLEQPLAMHLQCDDIYVIGGSAGGGRSSGCG